MAGAKGNSRARAIFLMLLGLILIGLGASLYTGSLDLGSLTKTASGSQQTGSPWAYVPVGFGALIIVVGAVLAVRDRRRS